MNGCVFDDFMILFYLLLILLLSLRCRKLSLIGIGKLHLFSSWRERALAPFM